MSQTQITYSLIRIQSIGNSINLAIYIYRYHIKQYFKLALIAYFWLLVPIYGWAKFYATSALISRLVFCELINQKESQKEAKSKIYAKTWSFLIAGILVFIIPLIGMFIFLIIVSTIFVILNILLTNLLGFSMTYNRNNIYDGSLFNTTLIIISILSFLSPLWFYFSLFVAELPLAIIDKSNAFKTILQSWKITNKFKLHLLTMMSLSYLIILPIQLPIQFLVLLVLSLIISRIPAVYSLPSEIVGWVILIILYVFNGVISMPFWQALKAIVYYDLRCRKEGFNLQLHNR